MEISEQISSELSNDIRRKIANTMNEIRGDLQSKGFSKFDVQQAIILISINLASFYCGMMIGDSKQDIADAKECIDAVVNVGITAGVLCRNSMGMEMKS